MNKLEHHQRRVAIIGGGISGLATAHRLAELDPDLSITLLESADRIGGVLQTVHQDGYMLESAADNWITNIPYANDLCERIGLGQDLLGTRPTHRHAFVVRRGRLCKIPEGFVIMAPSRVWPVVTTPILSPWGKVRMACEYFQRGRNGEEDESLATFVTRRFGKETYERLVQPLLGGIYTGDPHKLSLQATMPRFRTMEKQHGSLIRAVLKQAKQKKQSDQRSSGGRYSMFVAPREGISSLLDALAARLPRDSIQLNSPVRDVRRETDGRWHLTVGDRSQEFDAVIVATQAKSASKLTGLIDTDLSHSLGEIVHTGCAIVALAFRRDDIAHPLDGFGFVVPKVENRQILSGSFSSVKYEGRAPEGMVLFRVFMGGAYQPELLELDDDRLSDIAVSEMSQLLGIQGPAALKRVTRLPESMPQYYVGHLDRVAEIKRRASHHPGLFLTGNAYAGVGIPFCVHSAEETAAATIAYLEARHEPATT
jgi:oxygen-dependent protoporphyrinogen oxidase